MFSSGRFSASREQRLVPSSTDACCCSHYLEKRHQILPNSLQWLPLPIIPIGGVGWSPISRLAAVATQGFGGTSNPNLVWYNFSSTMFSISSYELNNSLLPSPLFDSPVLFCWWSTLVATVCGYRLFGDDDVCSMFVWMLLYWGLSHGWSWVFLIH